MLAVSVMANRLIFHILSFISNYSSSTFNFLPYISPSFFTFLIGSSSFLPFLFFLTFISLPTFLLLPQLSLLRYLHRLIYLSSTTQLSLLPYIHLFTHLSSTSPNFSSSLLFLFPLLFPFFIIMAYISYRTLLYYIFSVSFHFLL